MLHDHVESSQPSKTYQVDLRIQAHELCELKWKRKKDHTVTEVYSNKHVDNMNQNDEIVTQIGFMDMK